jgi:hypothetical protein
MSFANIHSKFIPKHIAVPLIFSCIVLVGVGLRTFVGNPRIFPSYRFIPINSVINFVKCQLAAFDLTIEVISYFVDACAQFLDRLVYNFGH